MWTFFSAQLSFPFEVSLNAGGFQVRICPTLHWVWLKSGKSGKLAIGWPFDVYHFLSALFSASKMNFFWPWNRKIFQNQKLCFLLIFLTWQFRAWNMFQKYWNLCRTEYEVKLLRFVQVIVWLRECKIFFKKIALFTLHKQCFCC